MILGAPAGFPTVTSQRLLLLPKIRIDSLGIRTIRIPKKIGHGMLLPGPGSATSDWRKSSYSLGNGECIEIGSIGIGVVMIRDSKDAAGPVLRCGTDEWRTFISTVKL
jgi:uncharacterized protein DUF397